jgi:D-ribose pyranose/furanose isomerase RbsD
MLLYCFALTFVVACNQSTNGPKASVDPTINSQAVDTSTPVPVEATTFETQITTSGLSVDQVMDVQKASEIIKQVVASQEFKDRILNHTVNGKKTFLNNNGLSNQEIYLRILEAAEDHDLNKDNIMELVLEVVPTTSGTGGLLFKLFPKIQKVLALLNLFRNTTPTGIAQNLFQMWLGKLGFALPGGSAANGSVQVAVAKIIGELGKNLN